MFFGFFSLQVYIMFACDPVFLRRNVRLYVPCDNFSIMLHRFLETLCVHCERYWADSLWTIHGRVRRPPRGPN